MSAAGVSDPIAEGNFSSGDVTSAAMSSTNASLAIAVGSSAATGDASSISVAIVMAVGAGGAAEEVPETPTLDIGAGGGAYGHPDMQPRRKKKPVPAKAEAADGDFASFAAEADFLTLWEAVKIRNDPERRARAEKKRIAMLIDLEKASLVRQ
jgi:hypothetical protein